MSIKIYSHNNGEGSRALANELNCRLLRHNNSRYRPARGDIVVNWGCHTISDFTPAVLLNQGEKIRRSVNKLSFFKFLEGKEGVRLPEWCEGKFIAKNFIDEGSTVICRTLLNSFEGRGIVVAKTENELVDARLYTKYIPKRHEYRIHVFKSKVIDQTKKVLKHDYKGRDDVNFYVRNTANGFVFQRNGIIVPESVNEMAIKCVNTLELDFGAVDIILDRNGLPYILEVNTAPGIEGTTVKRYADAIRGLVI